MALKKAARTILNRERSSFTIAFCKNADIFTFLLACLKILSIFLPNSDQATYPPESNGAGTTWTLSMAL
jgi:hypothetical protein